MRLAKSFRLLCRASALTVVLAGITLIALNLALIVIGIITFQILNPAYGMLLAICFGGWIAAFILAGALHMASGWVNADRRHANSAARVQHRAAENTEF